VHNEYKLDEMFKIDLYVLYTAVEGLVSYVRGNILDDIAPLLCVTHPHAIVNALVSGIKAIAEYPVVELESSNVRFDVSEIKPWSFRKCSVERVSTGILLLSYTSK
jgi:hypothetical protein